MSAESLMKLRQSGLFDEQYYNTQLKSTVSGDGAMEHFLVYGALHRLDPHPLFCTDFYLNMYPDVKNAAVNPLLHYIEYGDSEARNPHPLFAPLFYLQQFRPSLRPSSNLLMHYLTRGGFEGKDPHPMFDSAYYLRQNHRELAGDTVNPLVHYLTKGVAAGCNPHPFFDTQFYSSQLSDTNVNPLVDYVMHGAQAGRSPHTQINGKEILKFFNPDFPSHGGPFINAFTVVDRRDFSDAFERTEKLFTIPDFLLEPSQNNEIKVEFSVPTLKKTVSQLCTASQFEESEYRSWCEQLATPPDKRRKLWEHVFILAALDQNNMLNAGNSGIGFGTGEEPLPSYFAKLGINVMATDAPDDCADIWSISRQHAESAETLFHENIVEREKFAHHVTHSLVDMNSIPPDLQDYDFCWSACALEHLGSIEKGLQFIENSLDCVKPGGLIVHTTEFNLDSNEETVENKALSIFRRKDIERLLRKLASAGHEVFPLNLWPGDDMLDKYFDLPPYSLPHLKLQLDGFTMTSLGIIVRKACKQV